MSSFPAPQVVSRALRRDAGIITNPRGYQVRRGMEGVVGPSISVVVSDVESRNMRAARDLAEHLTEYGWDVRLGDGVGIIYVSKVPSAAEVRKIQEAAKA